MITHGHIMVNGRKLDIPSYLVRPGDQIQVKNREHSRKLVAGNLAAGSARRSPTGSTGSAPIRPKGGSRRLPSTQDVSLPVTPQLIVELLSR